MFNWIICDVWQYMEPFNFVDSTELFDIEQNIYKKGFFIN